MKIMKSIGWMISLSVVAGGLMAPSAQAQRVQSSFGSFSDITGTNIWNNIPPLLDSDGIVDPELVRNITRFNEEAETAFNACNAAIAQLEQNFPTTRRFARQPSNQMVEVPVACRQLEQLRAQGDNLRVTVERVNRTRSRSQFAAW